MVRNQLRKRHQTSAIAIWGLAFVLRTGCHKGAETFLDDRERWPYLFASIEFLLTAFGSTYYHLAPDSARLVWDRLPITITIGSMVSAVIAERVNVRLADQGVLYLVNTIKADGGSK